MVKRRFFLSITVGVSSVISAANGSIASSIPAVSDIYLPIILYAIGTYGAALLYHFSVYLVFSRVNCWWSFIILALSNGLGLCSSAVILSRPCLSRALHSVHSNLLCAGSRFRIISLPRAFAITTRSPQSMRPSWTTSSSRTWKYGFTVAGRLFLLTCHPLWMVAFMAWTGLYLYPCAL